MSPISAPAASVRGGYHIRIAQVPDTVSVRQLDDLCFPPDRLDLQPADPGELEDAVAAGDVRLLEHHDRPVGYLHADTGTPGQIFVSGLAIHPRMQRQGLGTWMIQDCIASIPADVRRHTPIVTVTSPHNLPMLRILFLHGFAVRWVLRDHFGPGRDRLALQLRVGTEWAAPTATRRIRADLLSDVYRAVERDGLAVRGLVAGTNDSVPLFELAGGQPPDFPPGAAPPRRPPAGAAPAGP